jgi:hypothetical protein
MKVAVLVVSVSCVLLAQESAVRTRQLWDTSLMSERPAAPQGKQAKAATPPVRGLVGVTVWRLRPSVTTDRREIRALIQPPDGNQQEWTPERVSADTALKEGQHVRVSVESGETGYLYIIDQDEYANGQKSDAYLIFPTTRTRGGDNKVSAGVVVQIPSPEDRPSYFDVVRSRPDQMNETLMFLVTPKPITDIALGPNRIKLKADQLAQWEKQAQTKAYRLEAKGSEGASQTVAELQATTRGVALNSGDPPPQTMYRVESKPGDSIMVRLPLKIVK